jgi:uncharacterized membrane protein
MTISMIEQTAANLTGAFGMIIILSLVMAVGIGLLAGLAWLYIKCGTWVILVIRQVYSEVMAAAKEEAKRQAIYKAEAVNGKRIKA